MQTSQIITTIILSVTITCIVLLSGGWYVIQNHQSTVSSYLFSTVSSQEIEAKITFPDTLTTNEQIQNVIAASNPAVVSVVITKDIPTYERFFEEVPFGFFGSITVPRLRQSGTEAQEVGGGSGFLISKDGLIVTNRHVVDDESASYSIITNEGVSYQVTVVAKDPVLDIAILAITNNPEAALPWLSFASSSDVAQGETVIAIGNALAEFRNSASVGIISGLSRTIVAGDRAGMRSELSGLIQTDAAINPGNSGGPLLNLEGEVVGVNVAASTAAENIGFAIPAHVVEEVIERFILNQ